MGNLCSQKDEANDSELCVCLADDNIKTLSLPLFGVPK